MTHRQKLGVALVLLAAFQLLIVFAGFFAPYGFATQDRERPFAAPTTLHFRDAQGHFRLRPFILESESSEVRAGADVLDARQVYPVRFFVDGAPYKIAGIIPAHTHLFGVEQPGRIFLMGSDAYGRDQFSRFLFGGQISLLAGLIAAMLSVSIGILMGGIAGYYGGWADELLMRYARRCHCIFLSGKFFCCWFR